MGAKEHVLFLSHQASRTGAPLVLLHFLRWFKDNCRWPFHVILNSGGELLRDFADLAPTVSLDRLLGRERARLRRIVHRYAPSVGAWADASALRRALRGVKPTLVYANSADNAESLDALPRHAAPVICHVHEMEHALRWGGAGLEKFERVKRRAGHWVAAAEAVAENLVDRHHIPRRAIDVVPGFVPLTPLPPWERGEGDAGPSSAEEVRRGVRRRLGLPADVWVVGGCGAIGWRKGTDLFVQMARAIRQARPDLPVTCVWVGGGDHAEAGDQARHDLERAGLAGRVVLTGPVDNPRDYFTAFDVFALPSREDPFPLVCLEAAALGVPIVCFEGAGSMPAFVEDGCGVVVPYLDVAALAGAVLDLLGDPARRAALGAAAREKVRRRHDVSTAAPQWMRVLEKVRSAPPAVGLPGAGSWRRPA